MGFNIPHIIGHIIGNDVGFICNLWTVLAVFLYV